MTDIQTEPSSNPAVPRSITREMHESYLTYALSVIHSRALPDVRDGLKPSQRRILVAMNDLNLGPRAKYRKCAKIAGDTSGNYHPHGESVIYPTLVRMAQDFSLRYPLVDGQGNFGSIDADPPAAMRYTEARMTGMSTELMSDLDKDTVEFEPNYDETRTQPTVLPSRFPNLLCNGSDGIAVGMATSMPPHNLHEICDAALAILDDPEVSIRDLMEIVPGPDFPTGGIIMGRHGIHSAYTTGRGRVRVRARHHVEDTGKRQRLIFTEIPYQTRKAADRTGIIAKIVETIDPGGPYGAKEAGEGPLHPIIPAIANAIWDAVDSPNNGVTYCQGMSLIGEDPHAPAETWGMERIFFAHARNQVRHGPSLMDHEEVPLESGDVEIARCVRAMVAAGYDGVIAPEHLGPQNLAAAIAYLRALLEE